MRAGKIFQDHILTFIICSAMLVAIMPRPAKAGEATFSFFTGKPEALIQPADEFVRKMYPDAKKQSGEIRESSSETSSSASYSVQRMVTDFYGPPGAKKPGDVNVVSVSVTVHKPAQGQQGAQAEATTMKRVLEHFTFLMNDDLQFKEVILEKSVPDRSAPAGTRAFYRLRNRLQMTAANVFITVSFDDSGYKDLARPDLKALADAMLAGLALAGPAAAGTVEVFPYAGLSPSNKGLIPASDRLPARIVYSGAKPGEEVKFSLPAEAPGELRGPGTAGKTVSVPADQAGRSTAEYFYKSIGSPLAKPLKLVVNVSAAGQTHPAEVSVGLGLFFDKLKAVSGQTYENDTHAFTLTVKSQFHPELNVASYLFNADQAKVWPNARMGLKLYTEWVNRPADGAHDDYYMGTANIVSGDEKVSFLVANQTPWYAPPGAKFFYPAVVMKSAGKHAYRVNGRGAVLGNDGSFLEYLDEKMVRSDTLLFLTKDDPENWYQSLACSLEATTETQYLMLEAVKLVPVYGAIADKATMVTGVVCGLLQENYEKTLMDVANWVGANYLDNLMEPAVFNKLTKKQQDAVLAAKDITTGGTDNLKRKQDVDELRNTQ